MLNNLFLTSLTSVRITMNFLNWVIQATFVGSKEICSQRDLPLESHNSFFFITRQIALMWLLHLADHKSHLGNQRAVHLYIPDDYTWRLLLSLNQVETKICILKKVLVDFHKRWYVKYNEEFTFYTDHKRPWYCLHIALIYLKLYSGFFFSFLLFFQDFFFRRLNRIKNFVSKILSDRHLLPW